AGQDLEQRALARPVGSDYAQELAVGHLERDAVQGEQVAVPGCDPQVRDPVLERRAPVKRYAEPLGEVLDRDGGGQRLSAKSGASFRNRRRPATNTASVKRRGTRKRGPARSTVHGAEVGVTMACRKSSMICARGFNRKR